MNTLHRTIFLLGILCLPQNGKAEIILSILPDQERHVLGEPMDIAVQIKNTGRGRTFLETQNYSDDRGTSGMGFRLSHIDSGREIPQTGSMPHGTPKSIEPDGVVTCRCDVASLFSIKDAGKYRIQMRYVEYFTIVESKDGKDVFRTRKVVDVESKPSELIVELPDPETIGKIEALFRSGKDEDIEQAIRLMATVRPAIYRKGVPALWTVIRTRQGTVKNHATEVFFNRIDLLCHQGDMDVGGNVLSDNELFSELEYASTSPDASVRVAAAQAISAMQTLWRRRQAMNSFIAQKTPKWFDGETSPDCRAALVRYLPVPKSERLISIVQQDSAPQVRVAAIQRLIELDPHRFLESADSFAQLSGEVTIEGQTRSFGAFVAAEKSRIERYLRPKGDSIEEPRDAPPR